MKKPKPGFKWQQFEQSLRQMVDRVFDRAEKGKCPACGSDRLQWRGRLLLAQSNAKRRVRCMACGTWGTRLVA